MKAAVFQDFGRSLSIETLPEPLAGAAVEAMEAAMRLICKTAFAARISGPAINAPADLIPKHRPVGLEIGKAPGGNAELSGQTFAIGSILGHETPPDLSSTTNAGQNSKKDWK